MGEVYHLFSLSDSAGVLRLLGGRGALPPAEQDDAYECFAHRGAFEDRMQNTYHTHYDDNEFFCAEGPLREAIRRMIYE